MGVFRVIHGLGERIGGIRMKKILFALFFSLACGVAFSQTFKVQNLQVLGTATLTLPSGSVQYTQGATGSVTQTVTSKLQQTINAADFGALCNGVHDDTASIQAAANTGAQVILPAGTCIVTNGITIPSAGQIIKGQGHLSTIIQVPATFNLSALGVFIATAGQEGPIFRDFQIAFVQPDTNVRANLVAYPPAFYMRTSFRFRIEHVRIIEAMTGIDLAGGTNSGGATMDDVEISAFNIGINIDGAQDSIRISKLHFWPFNLTTNQTSIFYDGNVTGIQSGRADDLHISDGLFIASGAAIKLIQTASGTTFGDITTTDFDTYGGLVVQAGQIAVSSSFFSVGSVKQAILQTGGFVKCSSCEFEAAGVPTTPLVQISGSASGYLEISNSMFRISGDESAVNVSATSGANTLILMGNQFLAPQATSPSNPIIACASGGRLTAIGNRASDKGSGTGNFISVIADENHNIIGNSAVGWGYAHPTFTTAVFANNN